MQRDKTEFTRILIEDMNSIQECYSVILKKNVPADAIWVVVKCRPWIWVAPRIH